MASASTALPQPCTGAKMVALHSPAAPLVQTAGLQSKQAAKDQKWESMTKGHLTSECCAEKAAGRQLWQPQAPEAASAS